MIEILVQCCLVMLAVLGFRSWYSGRKLSEKYSTIPGPPPLPFIGNLYQIVTSPVSKFSSTQSPMKTMIKIMEEYQGFAIFWIGREPVIVTSDPNHLQTFYTNPNILNHSRHYDFLSEMMGGDFLLTANGERWRKLRKMFMTTFHPVPNHTVYNNIRSCYKDFSQTLKDKMDGSTIHCRKFVKTVVFNTALLNSTGRRLDGKTTAKIIKMMEYFISVFFLRHLSIFKRFNCIFYRLPQGKKILKYQNFCKETFSKCVSEAKSDLQQKIENSETIPNLYIYTMLQKYGKESHEDLTKELLNMIITSLDSTSKTSCFLLMMLGLYPEIQERIYEEDQEIRKYLAGNDIEVTDLDKYVYLEQVIKETLRLFPVGPVIARELTGDIYFGKYLLPKGTNIGALLMHTNRRPEYFPDPLKFDPDRFLPENSTNRHPYAYNPFSAGPRGCPGNRYAMIVMKTLTLEIVRDFFIKSHYRDLNEVLDNVVVELTSNDKNNFPIKLLLRNKI